MVAASSSRAAVSLAEVRSHPSSTRLLDRASERAALSIRATRSRGSETLILTRVVRIRGILPLFLPECPPYPSPKLSQNDVSENEDFQTRDSSEAAPIARGDAIPRGDCRGADQQIVGTHAGALRGKRGP
jgi:hypothetical protein